MPITYVPRIVLGGYDGSVAPKWQMVPVGGQRVLTVTGIGALVPRVHDQTIATATVVRSGPNWTLTITGIKAGKTWLHWVPSLTTSGPVLAANTLELSVKAEKRINTAFHYIADNAGHATTRSVANIDALVTGVNAFLTPQANVKLVKKSAAAATVAQNLGTSVRFSSHLTGAPDNVPIAEHEWDDVTALGDAAADFNVYFVWEYEQDNTPNVHNVNAGTLAAQKNCIMDDHSPQPEQTLAHETIHMLGVAGHTGNNTEIMFASYAATAVRIPRAHANQINASGT